MESEPRRVEELMRSLVWHGADAALLLAVDRLPDGRLVELRRQLREEVADYAAGVESPPEWRELREHVEALRAAVHTARQTAVFFANVIKCREDWTPTCQAALDRALGRTGGE